MATGWLLRLEWLRLVAVSLAEHEEAAQLVFMRWDITREGDFPCSAQKAAQRVKIFSQALVVFVVWADCTTCS